MENLVSNSQEDIIDGADVYVAPSVEIEEVIVEQGFADSPESAASPSRGGASW